MLFNYNGKLNVTQKHKDAQGKNSLFYLMKEVHKLNFNVSTLLSLFDTYLSPVLNYCSEIWGYTGCFIICVTINNCNTNLAFW